MAPECGVPPEGSPEGISEAMQEVFGEPQTIAEAMQERADRIRGIVEEGPPAEGGAETAEARATRRRAERAAELVGPPGTPTVASGTGAGPVGSRIDQDRQRLHDRIRSDFTYHSPVGSQPNVYYEIRERSRALAHFLVDHVPPGRELSRALSDLEDMVMHANAGVARNPNLYTP